jgi:serine/threonine-protein kinase RsbW
MAPAILTIEATLDALVTISDFIVEQARAAGLDEHTVWEVQLAVDEAATNIIQHSYAEQQGEIQLTTEVRDDELEIRIVDHGRRFNPDDIPEPDLTSPLEERRTGGLGLYLMRKLMDQVKFCLNNGENILVMTKRIRQPDPRIVSAAGRIDAATAPELERTIRNVIADGSSQVIVDLHEVSFLSSSGLRTLLLLARELRRKSGDLVLCSLQPQVAEVFHLTGFDQIFQLHHTREEAAAHFGKNP